MPVQIFISFNNTNKIVQKPNNCRELLSFHIVVRMQVIPRAASQSGQISIETNRKHADI